LSIDSNFANSDQFFSIKSASLFIHFYHSTGAIFLQTPLSNAFQAAYTALSISSTVAEETLVIFSSVAGLKVSNVLLLAAD